VLNVQKKDLSMERRASTPPHGAKSRPHPAPDFPVKMRCLDFRPQKSVPLPLGDPANEQF